MRGCYERCAALVLPFALLVASALAANAQSSSALAQLAADTSDETDAVIAGVAITGNPLAAPVLEALQEGRLLFTPDDKTVYHRDATGSMLDAAHRGAIAGAEPAGGRSRSASTTASAAASRRRWAALTLLSPDPATRLEAARCRLQVAGRQGAAGARRRHRQGDRRARQDAPGGARRGVMLYTADASEGDKVGGCRRHPRPRRSGRARPAGRHAGESARRPSRAVPRRSAAIDSDLAACGAWCRTSGTACRSARCCCSPPSASPSPSA